MPTLVASSSILNGTSGPQQWSADVKISALTPTGTAAKITHSTDGFGVSGGRTNAQLDHIPSNNTTEQFVLEFSSAVTDAVLQFGKMNANEAGGKRETGTWTAFDQAGTAVASGAFDPANGTLVGSLTYDIPINTAGKSFSKLVIKATGYNGGTTGSSTGDSSDFALKQLSYTPAGTTPPSSTAEAYIGVTASGGLNASTYTNGAFKITNNSAAGQEIDKVTIKLDPSLLPYMVFDPKGLAGDSTAKAFTANSGASTVGYASGSATLSTGSDAQGWLTLNVPFSDFDPGETFTFSIDVDPASIKGTPAPGPNQTGSVSGLELVGSTATVVFSDGSTATAELFAVPNTSGGGQATVKGGLPGEPTLSVMGVSSAPTTVNTAAQKVVVTGPAGADVRVLVVEGGAYTDGAATDAQKLGAFDANTALKVTQYSAVIGSNGSTTVDVQLTNQGDGKSGLNYITAALQDGKGATGPATAPIVLKYDPTSSPPPGGDTINFQLSTLGGENSALPSSLQFGPDGKLYVADLKGKINVYQIAKTDTGYGVTASETIDLIQKIPNHNDNGSSNSTVAQRQITGIVVTGTDTKPVIYVSSSDPRWGGGATKGDVNLDTNSGIISRLTKTSSGWEKLDIVRGLPRSEENHSSNGLQYDPSTNKLLLAQGGHTNAGAPSQKFAYLNEFSLSAAVLAIDLGKIGNTTYDIPTVDDPTRTDGSDPFGGNDGLNMAKLVAGGPVQVFSPGFRNAYDLVITKSGKIYTIDNGPNATWGGWPVNEGTNGTVTNQYDPNEPGSDQVNNKDGLHLISQGYYGGHPNPLRANPDGAGLYTNDDAGLAVWRQQGGKGTQDLPATWLPVDPSLAKPVEGDFQMPGVADGSLYTWSGGLSVNGLDEYTSAAFSGKMQGNLLAAALDNDTLYRIQLSADGTNVVGVTALAANFANQPLDVLAQGDTEPFPGTVWITSLDGSITVLTPAGGGGSTGDADGDGYSDSDETANGTDPKNAASKPPDFDGDLVSDLNDKDDDNDGLLDPGDHFARDAANGTTTAIASGQALFYPMFSTDPGTGMFGLGFTGLMNNGATDYLNQYVKDNLIAGGATGTFTIVKTSSGDAVKATNTQQNGFQFGVDLDSSLSAATVTARVLNPFKAQTPENWQAAGIQIGTGDQDNYLKIVVSALNGPGGIQVLYEEKGAAVKSTNYAANGILTTDSVDLFLKVEPGKGLVTPSWEYTASDGQTYSGIGNPVTVSGNVLAAIQGTYQNQGVASGLAVGVINTHWKASSPIEASYDHIAVYAEPASTSTTSTLTTSSQGPEAVTTDTAATHDSESPRLSTADILVPQADGGYDDIDFEFIGDRTAPGILGDKPAAIIAKGKEPLQLDTTDVLLFHDNSFEDLLDLGPSVFRDINAGRAKGVLADVFDRVPGKGPPDDVFVLQDAKGRPTDGKSQKGGLSKAMADDPDTEDAGSFSDTAVAHTDMSMLIADEPGTAVA